MKETCGKNYILNGELVPAVSFDDSLVYKGDSVYEVIRLSNGLPFFFDDHMQRLAASLKMREKEWITTTGSIATDILKLSESERRREINIRLVFNYNEEKVNYLLYYIDSAYPSEEQYRKGVKAILFYAERKDPEAKVMNYRLRSSIHQELVSEGAYEALLVNEANLITEGSKSNLFFLKGEELFSAPDNLILKGVTRKYILQICSELGIKVNYNCVNADDLENYQSVFMTGTSPMVLPFCCINEQHLNPGHPLIKILREQYVLKAVESIRKFRESHG